jgi:hypothetical protein
MDKEEASRTLQYISLSFAVQQVIHAHFLTSSPMVASSTLQKRASAGLVFSFR